MVAAAAGRFFLKLLPSNFTTLIFAFAPESGFAQITSQESFSGTFTAVTSKLPLVDITFVASFATYMFWIVLVSVPASTKK